VQEIYSSAGHAGDIKITTNEGFDFGAGIFFKYGPNCGWGEEWKRSG
jgi:hypothetical protein